MADVELCTNGFQGPYLVAVHRLADELRDRFDAAHVPCEVSYERMAGEGTPVQCVIRFKPGVVLGTISAVLNEGGFDWELAGW